MLWRLWILSGVSCCPHPHSRPLQFCFCLFIYLQFKRLQGKRNRGREEINFVEIKGDDQLSGAQQWMTKSLTEEKTMKSFSKVSVGTAGVACAPADLLSLDTPLAGIVAQGSGVYKLHGKTAFQNLIEFSQLL